MVNTISKFLLYMFTLTGNQRTEKFGTVKFRFCTQNSQNLNFLLTVKIGKREGWLTGIIYFPLIKILLPSASRDESNTLFALHLHAVSYVNMNFIHFPFGW